jgi:hypothetical protein
VPESCTSEFEITVGKGKSCKSPGVDKISAEVIQAGERFINLLS